ncbi:MAG: radical SAM protein, partial [Lachnospiraceae bacterium]|nr:radical SAM protein [Lachnospiraceae bacterium]
LPFVNDTEENIKGILNYCKEAKVWGIICFGMGLTLREGNREYFYKKLDEQFPRLKWEYQRVYGNEYEVSSPNNGKLMRLAKKFCQENDIVFDADKCFEYMHRFEEKETFEQLTLF